LFPRGPRDDELYLKSSDFVDHWGDVEDLVDRDQVPGIDRLIQVAERIATESEPPRPQWSTGRHPE
jgi:hypothetical protein